MYKITISEIEETESEGSEYKNTNKKDGEGNDIYGYVKTGKMEKETSEKTVYEQTKHDLDIAELAIYINRVK